MKRLLRKFGKYNVATFVIMGVGLITFLLTPLLLWLFDIDSDIIGLLIFLTGLAMWIVGLIVRKVRRSRNVEDGGILLELCFEGLNFRPTEATRRG